jgi:periplasmic divalent cation tolerance protein
MTGALVILCTCGSKDEAQRLASKLIEERLAACVNILPALQSLYRWQDKIEEATEILLLIKTRAERFALVRERITELHSYDTPEIIALPIWDGSEKYLNWIRDQVD